MAMFWENVNKLVKAGYDAPGVLGVIATQRPEVSDAIESMRGQGMPDEQIIGHVESLIKAPASREPNTRAHLAIPGTNLKPDVTAFVPLGSAMSDVYQGTRQLLGMDNTAPQNVEVGRAIEQQYPYSRGAAKVGIGSAMAVPVMAAAPGAFAAGASFPLRYAGAAGIGALQGATTPLEEGGALPRAKEVGMDAALAMAGQGVVEGGVVGAKALGRGFANAARYLYELTGHTGARAPQPQINQALRLSLRQQGIEWDRLPGELKQQLLDDVANAHTIDPTDAAANSRFAQAQSLPVPVPMTRGMATRDIDQQITEDRIRVRSPELQKTIDDAKAAIVENVKMLNQRGASRVDVGGASNIQALADKRAVAAKGVSAAFKLADETHGDLPADPTDIVNFVLENDTLAAIEPIKKQLLKANAFSYGKDGKLVINNIPMRELNRVREIASEASSLPKMGAGKAGQANQLVQDIIEGHGAPTYIDAVKLARANFKQFGGENPLVQRVSGAKGGGMKTNENISLVPDANVFEEIMRKDPKEILKYRQAVLTGNESELKKLFISNPELRKSGAQAVRDLRGAGTDWLISKSMTNDGFDISKFITNYRSMGGPTKDMKMAHDKAMIIFGPKAAQQLRKIVEVAGNVRYDSEAIAKGSARHNDQMLRGLLGGLAKLKGFGTLAEVVSIPVTSAQGRAAATYSPKPPIRGPRLPVGAAAGVQTGNAAAEKLRNR